MVHSYPELNDQVQKLMEKYGKESPKVMRAFMQLHESSTANGALSAKIKELMALAIGISVRCDGCISYHVHNALESGASREEIVETIGVAILMGGGPAVVYGAQALKALNEFEEIGLNT
ncbi:MAG: hypothetical protein PWP06_945 [Candidatus Marinimicrobia bacterium]|jgi:AhpD family alkylhydroperoxidase|nr:hypothetical protein [Candidatus Neomarinimicrobiota bacterium]